jgi:UDP-N-acetylglucosamine 2-epimerase (hydrolysing)
VRLIQLGESESTIHVVGSPDIDVMNSEALPTLTEAKGRYGLDFNDYSILIFHPVTTELKSLRDDIKTVVDVAIASEMNYLVVYPNNDPGTDYILEEYRRFESLPRFQVYPSLRFEYFLTLLKHARFVLGNSSAGVREAPHFGVPAINLGTRQNNRVSSDSILDVPHINSETIESAIRMVSKMPRLASALFGDGNSANRFHEILLKEEFWKTGTQKFFVDQIISAPETSIF